MKKPSKIILAIVLALCLVLGAALLIDYAVGEQKQKALLAEASQTKAKGPFFSGDASGSLYFRIPALLTTGKGAVIAGIDARFGSTQDAPNNLDTAVSRSLDGGKTWGETALVNRFQDYADFDVAFIHSSKIDNSARRSASFIDPALLEDADTGRIFMLVDMFPSGTGALNSEKGSGYQEIGGKKYLKLRKKGSSKYEYTVRENQVIYDAQGKPTEYSLNERMEILHNGEALTVRQKDIWYVFNLVIPHGTSQRVPMNIMYASALFQPVKTSYLALVYSDDQGATWSSPRLLNDQVKEEGMAFLGVGPGRGLEVSGGQYAGRLLFPVYELEPETKQQRCRMIYSDDHGETWALGGTPALPESAGMMSESQVIELPDGSLMLFARNDTDQIASAVSKDGGSTWSAGRLEEALTTGGSSCQLSVIRYSGLVDGKLAVLLSSPAAQGRKHGVIRIGLIEGQAGSYTIAWKYHYDVTGEEDAFSYSCLTELPNGEIGLLYEQNGSPQPLNMVTYRTYSMETLLGRQPQGPLRT